MTTYILEMLIQNSISQAYKTLTSVFEDLSEQML